jgi:hypothetical protein
MEPRPAPRSASVGLPGGLQVHHRRCRPRAEFTSATSGVGIRTVGRNFTLSPIQRAITVHRHSIFRHLENRRKRSVCVPIVRTLPIPRGFRLERSGNNTVLLSRCNMSLWTALY